MSLQITVTLTMAYQKLSTLINNAITAAALGIDTPRTCWPVIKFLYPDAGAAGVIYGTRFPALAGYAIVLRAVDEEEVRKSENAVYGESTNEWYFKSSTNGDLMIVELDD